MTRPTSRPDSAAIRRALAECMTLADIDDAMGWSPGTARRRRWSDPERGGLPPSDAELGGVPLWFRATIEEWRTARRGRTRRPAGAAAGERDEPRPGTGTERRFEPREPDSLEAEPTGAAPVGAVTAATVRAVPGPEPGANEHVESQAALTEAAADEVPETEDDETEVRATGPAPVEDGPGAETGADEEDEATEDDEDTEIEEDTGTDEDAGTEDTEDVAVDEPLAEPEDGAEEEPEPAPVTSGFDLEPGEEVLAHVHRAWRPAVVVGRDRRTVMVGYNIDGTRLGARQQRVSLDRVRRLPG